VLVHVMFRSIDVSLRLRSINAVVVDIDLTINEHTQTPEDSGTATE